jgi:hypothetical protein
VEYAHAHFFGAKLAIIIAESERGRFLWSDTDVLFFGDLSERLRNAHVGPILRVLRDTAHAYEPHLADLLGAHTMEDQQPVNAGFLLAERIPYDELRVDECLLEARDGWGWFTEQTVIAYCAAQMGSEFWQDDEMIISADDATEVFGSPAARGWRGRHYIAPHRHLFWRDALVQQIRGWL